MKESNIQGLFHFVLSSITVGSFQYKSYPLSTYTYSSSCKNIGHFNSSWGGFISLYGDTPFRLATRPFLLCT